MLNMFYNTCIINIIYYINKIQYINIILMSLLSDTRLKFIHR